VLLVSPDARFRRALRQVFEAASYPVVEASDNRSATPLLELWAPAAIVVDGSVAEGWELIAALKRRPHPGAKILFLAEERDTIPLRVVPKGRMGGELFALVDVLAALIGPAPQPPPASTTTLGSRRKGESRRPR
jgi:CheY-like chemotaxis protein